MPEALQARGIVVAQVHAHGGVAAPRGLGRIIGLEHARHVVVDGRAQRLRHAVRRAAERLGRVEADIDPFGRLQRSVAGPDGTVGVHGGNIAVEHRAAPQRPLHGTGWRPDMHRQPWGAFIGQVRRVPGLREQQRLGDLLRRRMRGVRPVRSTMARSVPPAPARPVHQAFYGGALRHADGPIGQHDHAPAAEQQP
ncbi:hypothetical protein D9M72_450950 [compost metagenome]